MQMRHVTQVAIWLLLAGISLAALSAETAGPIVSQAKDTPAVPYDAGFVKFLVPSASTDGRTAVLELQEMPGFDTPWHQHKTFDETFYVLEGTLTLKLKD
jgi:quercetin dioxygenase-like cupin family protein